MVVKSDRATRIFEDFMSSYDTTTQSKKQQAANMKSEQLFSLKREIDLIYIIKDILDELNSMKQVLTQQGDVIESMEAHLRTSGVAANFTQLVQAHASRMSKIQSMEEEAKKCYESVSRLYLQLREIQSLSTISYEILWISNRTRLVSTRRRWRVISPESSSSSQS